MSAATDAVSNHMRSSAAVRPAPHILPVAIALLGLITSLWAGNSYAPSGEDSRDYVLLAHNLVAGNGLSLSQAAPFEPSASRAPVYPVFLGLVYSVAGDSREAVLIVQSIVLALGCALLVSLAVMLFNQRVGLIAGLMFSLNPYFCRWAGSFLTEALYITLIIACIYVFTRALLSSRTSWFALSGLLWAVATLCRPVTLVMLAPMALAILLFVPKLDKRGVKTSAMVLMAVLALSPWVIRNWVSFGTFIPVQVRAFGVNLWLATLDPEDQPVNDWVETPARWKTKYPEINEWFAANNSTPAMLAAEKHLVSIALDRIASDPMRYLVSRAKSLPHLWLHSGKLWYSDVSFNVALKSSRYAVLSIKLVLFLAFSFLPLSLAAVGIYLSRDRCRGLLPLYLVPLVIGGMHMPMWIEERYGMPAVPFFLIFAAFALSRLKLSRTPIAGGSGGGLNTIDTADTLDRQGRRIDSTLDSSSCTVSVIIPAKNEGQTVVEMAEAVGEFCDEVIVVDGRSTDGSAETLRERGFKVVTDNGLGKGDAVRCGLAAATGDVVVIMDADGSHEPEDIPKLLSPIFQQDADMVVGCRMRGGSDEFAGTWELFVRLWGNNFLTMLLNTRYRTSLTDTQNGFRAARVTMLKQMNLRENKHTIELEMIMKALKQGYRVCQVQSHEYCRRAGMSSLSVTKQGPHFLRCLLRNIW